MPLITVANSPDKAAALAGLERWKAKHADIAGLLAVDDVLVDSMRGRSSTWTRVRINLRHVPEEQRPPQETPEPDDDPTREWRSVGRRKRQRTEASPSPWKNCRQFLRRNNFKLTVGTVAEFFIHSPSAELRRVTKAISLHVIVSNFQNQFRPQWLPRQIFALAPATLSAGHSLDAFIVLGRVLSPSLHGWFISASLRYGARNSTNSFRFAVLKLAQTPTCCKAPASSNKPSSSEPTIARSPFLCQRNPATTQSQSRSCFTLSITRLFGS